MESQDLASLIQRRRSSLLIDANSSISHDDIVALATAAQWAPNHKRTWPLRLCAVTGEARRQLGEVIATVMQQRGDDAHKVEKTRTKYMRSPLVMVVASSQGNSETETLENSYAVAAGIQNLLLLADSMGFAALWSSPAKGANDAITNFCGMSPTDSVMGLIYLGTPTQSVAEVSRPPVHLTFRS
ncbi:MAG: nitroreductase family protein [Ilumatobacteraceae bacterium]